MSLRHPVSEQLRTDGPRYPQPSQDILEEWSAITDLLAQACGVDAALVMRGNPESMEVMAASRQDDTPYTHGEKAPREGRLYCETVIQSQRPLEVEDAFHDPVWKGNPDTELGLASYYGVPVNWPDGQPFGTLCILSRQPRRTSTLDRSLMDRLSSIIELTLKLLIADQELSHLASHDPLTGLMNRRMFESVTKRFMRMAERQDVTLWILYWDLDHFKRINDAYGHSVGDELLVGIARSASEVLRESEALARLGGEEFSALLYDADQNQAERVVRRLMAALADSGERCLPGREPLTISCGLTAWRRGESLKDWVRRADHLMYEAKRSGRNGFRIDSSSSSPLARAG